MMSQPIDGGRIVKKQKLKSQCPTQSLHQAPLGGQYPYPRRTSDAAFALWTLRPTGIPKPTEKFAL